MAAVGEDTVYQRVLQDVEARSMRGLRELPRDHPAQNLKQVWDSIGRIKMPNGEEMIILDLSRLFIPSGARQEILETLHIAHLGVAKMSSVARVHSFGLICGEISRGWSRAARLARFSHLASLGRKCCSMEHFPQDQCRKFATTSSSTEDNSISM